MTEKTHPKYRPDIDGLRAIAVLSVVVYHAFPSKLTGGFAGVDVFFVISGFLITTILFKSIDNGSFSIVDFYIRRVRRIFPALSLVLASVLFFGWFCLFPDELQQLGKHTATSAGFIQNFILWNEIGYFDNASETKPLLHIWSLGIEEQFYFLWPLLLWGASKFSEVLNEGRHKRLYFFLATISVFTISFVLNLNSIKIDPSKTFYLPQYRFFELALGGILSWLVLYKPKAEGLFGNGFIEKQVKNVCSVAGLSILVIIFFQFDKGTEFPGKMALLPIFATAFIIWAGPDSWLNRSILSNKVLVWFGLISFPLYLWHWPILSFGRIVYGEMPTREFRLLAVAVSILLSWLTVKILEKPFRFGNEQLGLKLSVLCLLVFGAGVVGYVTSETNFEKTHTYSKLPIKRRGYEYAIGSSLAWYRGKNNWLFLGNSYDRTVQKLISGIAPSEGEVTSAIKPFLHLAEIGKELNIEIALIVGPNKNNIYSEFLPEGFVPSPVRYSSFFLNRLKKIPGLTVYDPTDDLLRFKKTEGILYWQTDTHWNFKGAFLAYSGFSKLLGLPVPQVEFRHKGPHAGDLIEISKLKDFPLNVEDNWEVVWKDKPEWTEIEVPESKDSSFSKPSIVSNFKPLINKKIWITGDSFTMAQKQFFNATFKEVRYIGHWTDMLKDLPAELANSKSKPDMIVIVRVERSF